VGVKTDGPSDAAVLAPRLGSKKGVAISNGINIRFGMIDPLWMAASCIDEAIRQIIAVGGSLDRIALLDNFCWGNPDKPDRLGALVRCADGCYLAAKSFGAPFISGKDSLYNEYAHKGKSLPIPGTILISAIGIVDDITKTVTMDLKKAGNSIYAVGTTFDELGGSIYLANDDQVGKNVPQVNFKSAIKTYRAVEKAVKAGLITSMHDVSEGGLAVALAEMSFAGGLGVTAHTKAVPYKGTRRREDVMLFSESNSRFLVEVETHHEQAFKKAMKGIAHARIGTVESTPELIVYGLKDQVVINANILDLKQVWQTPLR
jgi:phosphoribosylformylglycinamidine synthase